jgi:hypothetical protein
LAVKKIGSLKSSRQFFAGGFFKTIETNKNQCGPRGMGALRSAMVKKDLEHAKYKQESTPKQCFGTGISHGARSTLLCTASIPFDIHPRNHARRVSAIGDAA